MLSLEGTRGSSLGMHSGHVPLPFKQGFVPDPYGGRIGLKAVISGLQRDGASMFYLDAAAHSLLFLGSFLWTATFLVLYTSVSSM
uniref:Uncharacterized protein n=1 Tax=Utricularia reniformis TaxID=192314 RepID=A0A1Y0B161_9LAMI|nr:hypothetical protein AEK19_MT0960 [Utricularia reniformis]ART31185.1 hypothetical protein AEK19_MT0960 [Utricularia reniformis]